MLSRNQRPKIDEYADYLFIVLHFPVFDRAVGRLNTGELDIFVGPDFLVTIPNQPLQPVEYLFERCRQKEELREQLFSRGSGYLLYRIVDDSFDYCFPMLRKIGNKLDALEDEIFEGRSEEVVRDISNVKQEIINFRKVIRPQRPVLRDLEKVKQRFLAPDLDLEIYFDDIVDAHERIWDMLENYKEVVEALEETNESVHLPPRQRHPPRAHLDQRHRPAADPDREHLGHERRRPRRGRPDRLLRDRRRDGRAAASGWSPTSAGAAGSEQSRPRPHGGAEDGPADVARVAASRGRVCLRVMARLVSWISADFSYPDRLDLESGHHLRPIRADDAEIDLPAVMGSRESLFAVYGEAWGWPPESMSVDVDREDLVHHVDETNARDGFNYAVLNAGETELKAVYAYADRGLRLVGERARRATDPPWSPACSART